MNCDRVNPIRVAGERFQHLAVRHLVRPSVLVGAATENVALRSDDNPEHFVAESTNRFHLFCIGDVPGANLLVATAGNDNLAVRLKTNSVNGLTMPVECDELIARRGVKNFRRLVAACRRQTSSVG